MKPILVGLLIMLAGGAASWILRRHERLAATTGALGVAAGCVVGLIGALRALVSGGPAVSFAMEWPVPLSSVVLEADALSAFFLSVVFPSATLAAVFGWEYLRPAAKPASSSAAASWLWFSLLVVSMSAVILARNAILFLVAWETMSLSSFLLVGLDSERDEVSHAAWVYLVATHLGGAFLLAMFVLAGVQTGSFDFADWKTLGLASPTLSNVLFVLGLVGFGVKAGLYPLHVWLPEAHPAAPSHVSALMSGVMIKVGVYALLRSWSFLAPPPTWWGWLMVGIGLISGVAGVVLALAQRDLKRVLAYSSVENVGIIAMGLGIGLLGWSHGLPAVTAAAFVGALLHVLNHSLFKGLLFLAAGAVAHATGTRDMEKMGGLMKRMPGTGAAFMTGAAAISGLPPFNGFVGEFLIYAAALTAMFHGPAALAVPTIAVVAGLALIGGLATACFAKLVGIVFLGEPRDPRAAAAHEGGPAMRLPPLVLALACFAVVWAAPWLAAPLVRATVELGAIDPPAAAAVLPRLRGALRFVAMGSALLIAAVAAAAGLRRALAAGRVPGRTVTWDCGYAAPTARMQYTASSFSQPLVRMFRQALGFRVRAALPDGLFPAASSFETHVGDRAAVHLFAPLFRVVDRAMAALRWIQEGRVHVYVLYVALTLLLLLLFAV